jgi:hypothetical protein
MSKIVVNTLQTTDGLHVIDVASISTGGAGVITFPSNTKTFLRGDNTFGVTLALPTGSDAPFTTTVTTSQDVQRIINNGDTATGRGWAFRSTLGGLNGALGWMTADDSGAATANYVFRAVRNGALMSVLNMIPNQGRMTVGTFTDDGVNMLQVNGFVSASGGLNMPPGSRQFVAVNSTFDLYGSVVAASYYVNGSATVAGAGQSLELISLRPSAITISGAGAVASCVTFVNNVVSSIAGTGAYGVFGSVVNAGAGKSSALYGRAVGTGAHTGILIGVNGSVTTVAGTDTIATSAMYGSWTGPTSCHFGLFLTGEVAGDKVDYPICVSQLSQVVGSHILLQRGAAPCNTSANFMQCDDITSASTFFKLTSIGSMVFGGVAQRFQADFSNATIANRMIFQSATVNGITTVPFIPNGAGTAAGFQCYDASDTLNAARVSFAATTTGHVVNVTNVGTGVLRSYAVQMNSVNAFIVSTAGRVVMGANPTDNTTDGVQVGSANLAITTAGNGLRVKEGSNAKQGTSVLVAGTVVVANTSVTANSRIFLTNNTVGGTAGFLVVSARTPGTSFTILSSNAADTSTIAWEIFEPSA